MTPEDDGEGGAEKHGFIVLFDPRVTTPGPDGKTRYPPVNIEAENVTAENVLEAVLNNNNLVLVKHAGTNLVGITIK